MTVSKNSSSLKLPKMVVNTPNQKISSESLPASTLGWSKGLVDPFTAIGPKVPDMFCYPTITAQSKGVQVISSDSNGTILGAIAPYPTLSYVAVSGGVTTSSMYQYSGKPLYAATTFTNLSNLFSNYRVVSVGVRVRNLLAPLTATGRIIIAPYISSAPIPGPNFCNNGTVDGGFIFSSITQTATSGSNLLELPYAKEYSIQELIAGTVTWCSRPVSTESYHFHGTNNSAAASNVYYAQSEVQANGSLVSQYSDGVDQFSPNNYTGLIIFAQGLPININALELEYVYHYEGTPAMGLTAGSVMPETSTPSPVDMYGMSNILRKLAASDPVNLLAETALGTAGKMAMNFLKRL